MSTIDTSTWSPDTDLNTSINGIPLNADSAIAQTWLAVRALMAALKGDGDAIRAFLVPFSGATASADGAGGLVPAPEAGDEDKFLKGDGTWGNVPIPTLGTAYRAVQTDATGVLVVSSVTSTELGYLSGVTGAVQTQINGKADNATTLAGYGITDAKIMSGTITLGSSTITPLTSASSLDAGKLTGTASVDTTGNAATATAFSASKDVALTGAVTGTASSTGGWSVSTLWRSCVVGLAAYRTSNPWYKVATYSFASNLINYDVIITFLVENTYYRDYFGILRAHVRIDSDKTVAVGSTSLKWLVNNGLPIEDFVLVCPTTASPTVEIWTRISSGWTYRRFVVLSEGTRSDISTRWTLLNASSSTGQEASITTEGTQIASEAPDLVGNIAAATQFSANKSVTLTGDVTGTASSKAGWSIATTVGAITNAQIVAMFENDGIDPDDPPMAYPERAVLCGDGAWRYFEQIAFPN